MRFHGSWFGVQGLCYGFQVAGPRVKNLGFMVHGSCVLVVRLWFMVWVLGLRLEGSVSRV
jgi:hypothetical protein